MMDVGMPCGRGVVDGEAVGSESGWMKIAALNRLDWSSHQAAADGFWRMRMTASNGTVTEDHPCRRYGTDAKIIQIRYDVRFASLGCLAPDGLRLRVAYRR